MTLDSRTPTVVTLGESMIRYSPRGSARLEQAQELEMRVAGAASNVAIACARLGLHASWISKLSDNALGRLLESRIAAYGVDTSHVVWTAEHRVGTYYIEFGSPPRPTRVLYDRENSAFQHITINEIDWPVVCGADLFHITGITPALGASCERVAFEAMRRAKDAGVRVSFDVNYRSKLWSSVEEARGKLSRLLRLADVAFLAADEAQAVFGCGESDEDILAELYQEFAPEIVVLKRDDGATALHEGRLHRVGVYETQTVDPIGTGDAFAGGFIVGLLTGDVHKGLAYASALAALKRTIPGDVAAVSRAEVEALIEGSDAKIQR